ncbi:MAG: heavy metal translocating P-type ATPase [Hyphomicrobiaceae bacterium]|nr:heavy metal translocating P-type ATPase [Hyphomicrobiaceae bacterium]
MPSQRLLRRSLVAIALAALASGGLLALAGYPAAASAAWSAGTVPVALALLLAILRDLAQGRVGVDAIALLAMSAALAMGESLAGAVVALMYSGGNLLEDFAVARAERELRALVDRAPRVAHRKQGDGLQEMGVDDVRVGDTLVVRAGEIVPVDGHLASATALLDEAALTGEPLPVRRDRGGLLRSGTVNAGETFEMTASATAGESSYAGIVRMVTAAQTAKAPFMRMADRYALLLLPVTLIVAASAWALSGDPVRALAVLVAATPCPLILAAPVAFISGISRAARHGILIKGGGALEALAGARTVVFDKTGTLTVGGARLIAVETAQGQSATEVLRLAASLEQASRHVVAVAVTAAARARGLALEFPRDVRESMGSGLEGTVGTARVAAGSFAYVAAGRRPEAWAQRALRRAAWRSALSVFVSLDGHIIGALLLGDELRNDTPRAVQSLRRLGVSRILMLTGDSEDAAQTIGGALDLDSVLADRVPADKVDAVATEERLAPTVMVGDGINDAPALAAARVGIAMGARGASASSEAADVVILLDRIDCVPQALAIAQRTRAIALQSIWVGLTLSGAAMGLAAFGHLTPVAGALAQEAIDVAVILNALRALVPERGFRQRLLPATRVSGLLLEHVDVGAALDRLREIADALDTADGAPAAALIEEASLIVAGRIVRHEEADRTRVYPLLEAYLADTHGLSAMSRAHREILHLARLLDRLTHDMRGLEIDRFLVRDAQRAIEAIEALVRIHNAQEDDIYEHAAAVGR